VNTVTLVPAPAEPTAVVPAGADPVVIALAGRVPVNGATEPTAVVAFVATDDAGRVAAAALAAAVVGAVVGTTVVDAAVGVADTGVSVALPPPQAVRSAMVMSNAGIGNADCRDRRCISSLIPSLIWPDTIHVRRIHY
jgi:hypothetical protein